MIMYYLRLAEIGDFKSEIGLMETKGIANNPYATCGNMTCDAFPTPSETELPPIYEQVADDTPKTCGFKNPVYGMRSEEMPQEVYQEIGESKPEEEPSTATWIEKNNSCEV